ncbi:hypothetical protein ACFQ44_04615 [Levilactobacillus lanxiensis]|uniref:Uncharacterized protein n=1 Tax=Levilactobacillus lanxiensis TaxID=2799568 RepID=A0ABW4D2U5_9LACO|nr:hypothetical protein [Levilactobacillus lanxiensis]
MKKHLQKLVVNYDPKQSSIDHDYIEQYSEKFLKTLIAAVATLN